MLDVYVLFLSVVSCCVVGGTQAVGIDYYRGYLDVRCEQVLVLLVRWHVLMTTRFARLIVIYPYGKLL